MSPPETPDLLSKGMSLDEGLIPPGSNPDENIYHQSTMTEQILRNNEALLAAMNNLNASHTREVAQLAHELQEEKSRKGHAEEEHAKEVAKLAKDLQEEQWRRKAASKIYANRVATLQRERDLQIEQSRNDMCETGHATDVSIVEQQLKDTESKSKIIDEDHAKEVAELKKKLQDEIQINTILGESRVAKLKESLQEEKFKHETVKEDRAKEIARLAKALHEENSSRMTFEAYHAKAMCEKDSAIQETRQAIAKSQNQNQQLTQGMDEVCTKLCEANRKVQELEGRLQADAASSSEDDSTMQASQTDEDDAAVPAETRILFPSDELVPEIETCAGTEEESGIFVEEAKEDPSGNAEPVDDSTAAATPPFANKEAEKAGEAYKAMGLLSPGGECVADEAENKETGEESQAVTLQAEDSLIIEEELIADTAAVDNLGHVDSEAEKAGELPRETWLLFPGDGFLGPKSSDVEAEEQRLEAQPDVDETTEKRTLSPSDAVQELAIANVDRSEVELIANEDSLEVDVTSNEESSMIEASQTKEESASVSGEACLPSAADLMMRSEDTQDTCSKAEVSQTDDEEIFAPTETRSDPSEDVLIEPEANAQWDGLAAQKLATGNKSPTAPGDTWLLFPGDGFCEPANTKDNQSTAKLSEVDLETTKASGEAWLLSPEAVFVHLQAKTEKEKCRIQESVTEEEKATASPETWILFPGDGLITPNKQASEKTNEQSPGIKPDGDNTTPSGEAWILSPQNVLAYGENSRTEIHEQSLQLIRHASETSPVDQELVVSVVDSDASTLPSFAIDNVDEVKETDQRCEDEDIGAAEMPQPHAGDYKDLKTEDQDAKDDFAFGSSGSSPKANSFTFGQDSKDQGIFDGQNPFARGTPEVQSAAAPYSGSLFHLNETDQSEAIKTPNSMPDEGDDTISDDSTIHPLVNVSPARTEETDTPETSIGDLEIPMPGTPSVTRQAIMPAPQVDTASPKLTETPETSIGDLEIPMPESPLVTRQTIMAAPQIDIAPPKLSKTEKRRLERKRAKASKAAAAAEAQNAKGGGAVEQVV
ncbi:hypothetical protein MMC28_008589 [Mycoblastus sanguinarius]|nr:hypothetical protein [Mycoblastus sanguinarius]